MLGYCPASQAPGQFLTDALAYLDCQSRMIGAFGYEAVASSPGAAALLALVTVFVALVGARMMFGQLPEMRELAIAAAKIGLVLMLVTSWPAVRTLFFDTAFDGPAELAGAVAGSPEQGGRAAIVERLQSVDDAIVRLTAFGTGRAELNSTRTADGSLAADEFAGVALTDALALGMARFAWLGGIIATLGTLRLASGILLALLPLFAGLLLFGVTRGVFVGWARTMLALILSNAAVLVILLIELAFLEPWLQQMLAQRSAYLATPSAPTELLVMTSAFAAITAAAVLIVFKVSFGHFPSGFRAQEPQSRSAGQGQVAGDQTTSVTRISSEAPASATISRELVLANAIRRGERHALSGPSGGTLPPTSTYGHSLEVQATGRTSMQQRRRGAPRAARSRLKRDLMR